MKSIYGLLSFVGNFGIAWLFSKLVGWSFMETFFLSGLLVITIIWLVLFNQNRSNNMLNATIRGTTGYEAGMIKAFTIQLNPFLVGTVLYVILSGMITFVYYLPYFTS